MELSIYNIQGKETGRKIVLDESIFGVEQNSFSTAGSLRATSAGRTVDPLTPVDRRRGQ